MTLYDLQKSLKLFRFSIYKTIAYMALIIELLTTICEVFVILSVC